MKVLVVMLSFLGITFGQAQTHDVHSGHSHREGKPKLSDKKFDSTEDLRLRMEKILKLSRDFHSEKRDSKLVVDLGNQLTEVVSDIFKVCRLEPEADAAIHPILGLILEGAGDFKKGKYGSGQKLIQKALGDYENVFKHDGWAH